MNDKYSISVCSFIVLFLAHRKRIPLTSQITMFVHEVWNFQQNKILYVEVDSNNDVPKFHIQPPSLHTPLRPFFCPQISELTNNLKKVSNI